MLQHRARAHDHGEEQVNMSQCKDLGPRAPKSGGGRLESAPELLDFYVNLRLLLRIKLSFARSGDGRQGAAAGAHCRLSLPSAKAQGSERCQRLQLAANASDAREPSALLGEKGANHRSSIYGCRYARRARKSHASTCSLGAASDGDLTVSAEVAAMLRSASATNSSPVKPSERSCAPHHVSIRPKRITHTHTRARTSH